MFAQALEIMGIGMGTVFALLLALFGVIQLLMRLRSGKLDSDK